MQGQNPEVELLNSENIKQSKKWSNAYEISRSRGFDKSNNIELKPTKLKSNYYVYLAFLLFISGLVIHFCACLMLY